MAILAGFTPMKKVSIILVDYNSHQHTKDCLDSLNQADFTEVDVQVVVVDNGSKEQILLREDTYKNFSLRIVYSKTNTGFTGGNNQGIFYAKESFRPDFFLLLNNDTLVEKSFLQELMQCAENEKNVGIVNPMIYFAKGYEYHKESYSKEDLGKVIWFAGGSIDWKNMFAFHRGVDQVDRGQFNWKVLDKKRSKLEKSLKPKPLTVPYISTRKMDFATGCCMFIPAKVVEQVGVFDQAYFLYWEDVDLSERIKRAGYSLLFCPTAVIWHKNAGSSGGSGSSIHNKYLRRNRIRFAMKYASWKTKILLLRELFHV